MILNIHFALFVPLENEIKTDGSVEDMLKEVLYVIESHIDHSAYFYLIKTVDVLYFEYYFQLKLYKNASVYYDRLIIDMPSLLLSSHSSFTSHFLISKLKFEMIGEYGVSTTIDTAIDINIEEESAYVLLNFYNATIEFYAGRYDEAIKILSQLSSTIYLIDKPFVDIEIKMFLALLNCLRGTRAQVDGLLRGATRKISMEGNELKYHLASKFIKLLKVINSPKSKNKLENVLILNKNFTIENTGKYQVLEFLKLNDAVIKKVAMDR